jgi:hypothetical protein
VRGAKSKGHRVRQYENMRKENIPIVAEIVSCVVNHGPSYFTAIKRIRLVLAYCKWKLTSLFKSSLLTSGLTPMTFRNIRAIKSSRNIMISWSKKSIWHGFVPKCALGTFLFNLPTRLDSKGLQGKVVFIVIFKGPVTNKK